MPEKRTRRATSARRDQAEGDTLMGDGVIGRFVDYAFDNPAMSGGLFVMALTTTAIVSNALFLQNVRHPEPLFSTRPPIVIERHVPAAAPAPIPPRRDEETGSIAPPLPRPAPMPPAAVNTAEDATLIRDIQTALARKGLYLGSIDGKYGALSRSAIMSYEKAAGMPVTGEPSAVLLAHIRSAAEAPSAPPVPPAAAAVPSVPPPPKPVATGAPAVAAKPPAPRVPTAEEVQAEIKRLRYERVQTALNRIGYGPVPADGTANQETSNAIRRFELDNGLPISGAPGNEVVDRLVTIGALPAT